MSPYIHNEPESPPVTVIIVNWNSLHFLLPCLESLYGGAITQPFEVIVVDNASTDGNLEELTARYPAISVIRNPTNRGFAGANNQAIRHSHGRYILLLNPDTVLFPGTIDALWRFLEANPGAAVAGPQLLDSRLLPLQSHSSFPGPHLLPRGLRAALTASFAIHQQNPDHTARRVDWVGGACMLIRRDALEQVGMLDESFFIYFEEADLCWRLRERGWDTHYVPQARVIHYQGGSAATAHDHDHIYLDGILLDEWARSADRFLCKHLPAWTPIAFRVLAALYTSLVLATWSAVFLIRPGARPKARRVIGAYLRFLGVLPFLRTPARGNRGPTESDS
ncbi:MAG: glycosyltransferase family 2 protein [Bacteroidetes bacterium]|nr:glycosyltransferase family 2 protein [Bacteroidota bacterium]